MSSVSPSPKDNSLLTSRSMMPPKASNAFHHPRSFAKHLQQRFENLPKSRKHTMLFIMCLVAFLAVGGISGLGAMQHKLDLEKSSPSPAPAPTGNYSTNMALSIIARQQGIMTANIQPGSALEAGIVQKAFAAHNAYHGPHAEIQEYMDNSTASAVKYMASTIDDIKNWPLDRLSNGNAMLSSGHRDDHTYNLALIALRDSVHLNPRNSDHGLWYWEGHPEWSYLDGMYSLGPFSALDLRLGTAVSSLTSNNTLAVTAAALNDLHLQFRLLWDHCHNSTTGLLVHGYDASRSATWASRASGASAVVWGRSLGWFVMALVDTLEQLSAPGAPQPGRVWGLLLGMYQRLAPAVVRYADGDSRGWFQVVDMAGSGGNYVESSATAMFAYALLKGARLGYLDDNPGDRAAVRDAGRAAHALLVREFVTVVEDGTLGWDGTVAVCSLNSSATYDYYINQPIAPNSVLGAAAFILASLEVERLDDAPNILQ